MNLLEPKTVFVEDRKGTMHGFIVHRFPAIAGREIAAKYPTSIAALAKQWEENNYAENEKIMLKAMSYVFKIGNDDQHIPLTSAALVDNHVPDAECLMRLEKELLIHNFSFFEKFCRSISSSDGVATMLRSIMSMLTHSLQPSSNPDMPLSQT